MKRQRFKVYCDIRDVNFKLSEYVITVTGGYVDLDEGTWNPYTVFVELTHREQAMLCRGGSYEQLLQADIEHEILKEISKQTMVDKMIPPTFIANGET